MAAALLLILWSALYAAATVYSHQPPEVAGLLSVTAFGAKGDGAHDDAGAIQRAINASQAQHRGLWFPAGTYLINSTLVVGCTDGQAPSHRLGPRYPVHLYGDGSRQAVIKAAGARLHAVIFFASVARGLNKTPRGTTTDGHRVEGLGFDANYVADYALVAPGITRSSFQASAFTSARLAGLYLGFGWINTIEGNTISGNGLVGLHLHEATNAINVLNNILEGNRGIGLLVNGGAVVRIEGNTFESTGGPAMVANAVEVLTIRSNYMEGNNLFNTNTTFDGGNPIGPAYRFANARGGMHICSDIVLSGAPWQDFLPTRSLNVSAAVAPCSAVTIENNYHNVIISRCFFRTYAGVWAAAVTDLAMSSSKADCSFAPEPGPTQCEVVGGPNASVAQTTRNSGWTQNSSGAKDVRERR